MAQRAPPLVLVYGNSPALAAVEKVLRGQLGVQVIHIDPAHATATEQLAALGESTLVYDCRATEPAVIQAIHVLHPQVSTLGLGGGDGQDLVLVGRVYPLAAMEGLARVLVARQQS